jgi:hypothetical protein
VGVEDETPDEALHVMHQQEEIAIVEKESEFRQV